MWTMKVNDLLPSYEARLENPDGTPFNLSGFTATFRYRPRGTYGGWAGPYTARVVSASEGRVAYDWTAGQTAAAGVYQVEWVVLDGAGRQMTFPSDGYGEFQIFNG